MSKETLNIEYEHLLNIRLAMIGALAGILIAFITSGSSLRNIIGIIIAIVMVIGYGYKNEKDIRKKRDEIEKMEEIQKTYLIR